jgi:hypothetical protein
LQCEVPSVVVTPVLPMALSFEAFGIRFASEL